MEPAEYPPTKDRIVDRTVRLCTELAFICGPPKREIRVDNQAFHFRERELQVLLGIGLLDDQRAQSRDGSVRVCSEKVLKQQLFQLTFVNAAANQKKAFFEDITKIISDLEDRGVVAKAGRMLDDRRQTRLKLTPLGRACIRGLREPARLRLSVLLEGVDVAQLNNALDVLSMVTRKLWGRTFLAADYGVATINPKHEIG